MQSRFHTYLFLTLLSLVFIAPERTVFADQYSSSGFTITDPVVKSGHYATSSSYELYGTFGEVDIGTSTASSYEVRAGFLYFPTVSLPVVSTTPGDSQITLTWTAAVGTLGWTVSSYTVGQSTASGGPYTYTSVGNVLTSTRSSLTNGTLYYFVILAQDAFNNYVATSTEVSNTPVAGAANTSSTSVNNGGIVQSAVYFSGIAYPDAIITIFKDSELVAQTVALPDGKFNVSISGLNAGTFTFVLRARNVDGRLSQSPSYTVQVPANSTTNISNIYFPLPYSPDITKKDGAANFGSATSDKTAALAGGFGYEKRSSFGTISDIINDFQFPITGLSDWNIFYRPWLLLLLIILLTISYATARYYQRWHFRIGRTLVSGALSQKEVASKLSKLQSYQKKYGHLALVIALSAFTLFWNLQITQAVIGKPNALAPIVSSYSERIATNEIFYIRGRGGLAGSQVKIYLQSEQSGGISSFVVGTDKKGEWFYAHTDFLPAGAYRLWVQSVSETLEGIPSGQYGMEIYTVLISLGGTEFSLEAIYFLTTLILSLVILAFICIASYHFYHGKRKQRKLNKEIHEAEESIKKGFALLRKDIQDEIVMIQKLKVWSQLSQEKLRREEQLLADLEVVESHIEKEVRDIKLQS